MIIANQGPFRSEGGRLPPPLANRFLPLPPLTPPQVSMDEGLKRTLRHFSHLHASKQGKKQG